MKRSTKGQRAFAFLTEKPGFISNYDYSLCLEDQAVWHHREERSFIL